MGKELIRSAGFVTGFLSVLFFGIGGLPVIAQADSLNGFLEWNYSKVQSEARNNSDVTKTETKTLNQRYSLNLNKNLYPNLRLIGSGIFEKELGWLTNNDINSSSSVTTMRPSVDLILNTLLYTAGLGYSRRDETLKTTGAPMAKGINEDFHAQFGWRPLSLPKVDLQLTRTNTFDEFRLLNDITNDRILLGMRYQPLKTVDLKYQGIYSNVADNLQGVESQEMTNSARVTYSDQFFKQRVLLNTTYNVTRQQTSTVTTGNSQVPFQLFPFTGLYAASDTPAVAALSPSAPLTNGDTTTAAGIDSLGVAALTGGESRPRNIGVDFIVPTEVNSLSVYVDRDLPPGIAGFFSWDVYTTLDDPNLGAPRWVLIKTVSAAPFAPFLNSFRFSIDFPEATVRAVKVVVSPLTQVAAALVPSFQNPDKIFVTELQAFSVKPAGEIEGNNVRVSHIYNADVKARLLETFPLYYDGSLFLSSSSPSDFIRYTLSNGLHLEHAFNDKISGSSRVAREDVDNPEGHNVSYLYSASLKVVPLKTLHQTLIYSGRNESISGRTKNSNSLFLYSNAELYKGLNLNMSGGVTYVTAENGTSDQNYNAVVGASIIPNQKLSMNVNYMLNKNSSSGSSGSTGFLQQRAEFSTSFRPYPTLYLFASLGVISIDTEMDTLLNYGINWSPFPDGTIQFNLLYNENMRTLDRAKERLLSPSLSWKVTSKSLLDFSYSFATAESITQSANSNIMSLNYRIFF